MIDALFLYKNNGYGYGLKSSCGYVSQYLNDRGFRTAVEGAVDGNDVDRLVTQANPRHVFIEGLWVTPDKMSELRGLHPNRTWYNRIHSQVPFLANEGIAMDWLYKYDSLGCIVVCNNSRASRDLQAYVPSITLPNLYEQPYWHKPYLRQKYATIKVGCFGSVRPLKNQLIQFLAALEFAEKHGMALEFYVNGRVEQHGNNALKNILAAGKNSPAKVVQVGWKDTQSFLELLFDMDLSMQVSFTETFNIVTAQAATVGTLPVVSAEVDWMSKYFVAKNPTSVSSIVETMDYVWYWRRWLQNNARFDLLSHNNRSYIKWANLLRA